ncbi:MAG: threonine--tRNA ligase [Thermodesulfobacteriota bacterium]
MPQVKVKLPSGIIKEVEGLGNAWEALVRFEETKEAVAARVGGELADLSHPLTEDTVVEAVLANSAEGAEVLRHSTSHVMAQAVKELFPETKIAIGPAIEEGFYYDFDREVSFTDADLEKIEARMREIIARDLPFIREELPRGKAIELFNRLGEDYKVELLNEMTDATVSLYRQGEFVDLCRGPHLPGTSRIKDFKLLSVAGAYWRGDERNRMLQRVYGTAFFSSQALNEYLERLKQAKARDHRVLGKELELFSIQEEAGAGLVIYHPKGAILRSLLEDLEKREHIKRGYQLVYGPQLLKLDLWKKSGHYEHYREQMYITEVDGQKYALKPMNCLSHILIYKSKRRSYRDLPMRLFELGTVHRYEKSGVLHGLLRVREFTQDDAHLFCRPEQLVAEIRGVIQFVEDILKLFKFDYEVELSTKPDQHIGSDEDWDRATEALRTALKQEDIPYQVHEGEGAFYGPKIDLKLKDALNRKWQCATIQCDFALPERFDLTYMGPDGNYHRPAMIHRVILGALERFIGVLIEHYGGAFPTWLAPVQVKVLTVSEKSLEYANQVYQVLREEYIRVAEDFGDEKIGHKIREAQLEKVPYMLVIGNREASNSQVSPRRRDGKLLPSQPLGDFIAMIKAESKP